MRARAAAAVAAACTLALGIGPGAVRAAGRPPLRFSEPVLVSPEINSVWEPTVLADRFGNLFVTARKDTSQLVLAPDQGSPTLTRSMSWLWVSTDGGRTFANMPGLPLGAESHEWGYEAAIALDGADHLYFADQTYADSTISRWTVTGRGGYAMDLHRPLVPTAQPLDDRPWLAAHGDGEVFYIVNTGDPTLNPLGRDGGDAYGPGRFSVYHSSNGAQTFDVVGHSLRGSGGCRPATDRRPGSKLVYVACTNDGGVEGPLDVPHGRGTLWAYVSEDDGLSYARYRIGDYNADAETFDWPLIAVGPNGDVWVLHVDADKVRLDGDSFQILTNRLKLYHSTDHGRTWSRQDITPRAGRYRWGWLDVSSRGELALGIHHRTGEKQPWRVYASVFSPGAVPVLASIDEAHPVDDASRAEPPAEFVGLAFAPDDTLAVAWTRIEDMAGLRYRRMYFAHSIAGAPVRPVVGGAHQARGGGSLPATGAGDWTAAGLWALAASVLVARWLRRTSRSTPPSPGRWSARRAQLPRRPMAGAHVAGPPRPR
jgi:hypothetical protein